MEDIEFKLYIVKQQQDIFQINKTKLKYWFPRQKKNPTLNNGTIIC